MDADACSRWENILNITALGTDTLADRRFRILARINDDIPYTYKQLEIMIANLCGSDGYSLELQNATYTLTVLIALAAQKQFNEVEKLLKRVVPANIIIAIILNLMHLLIEIRKEIPM